MPSGRKAYRNALVTWLEQRSEALDPDSQARLSTNPLRILDSKNEDTQALLGNAPTLVDALSNASRERFEEVQRGLIDLGIPFQLNRRLVRGLDYYSHTAFEITSDQLGAQATVCGGGRYDGLISQLGGPQTQLSVGLLAWSGCYWCWKLPPRQNLKVLPLGGLSPPTLRSNRGCELKVSLSLWRDLRAAELRVELDSSVRPSENSSNERIAAVLAGPWCLAIRRLSEVKLV